MMISSEPAMAVVAVAMWNRCSPLRGRSLTSAAVAPSEGADVLNALLALGYSEKEAQAAIRQLAPDVGVSDGIRAALKLLSRV